MTMSTLPCEKLSLSVSFSTPVFFIHIFATMSFIVRRNLGRRVYSLNLAGAAFQPRTSSAFPLSRFFTTPAAPIPGPASNSKPASASGPSSNAKPEKIQNTGLNDSPELFLNEGTGGENKVDWSKSFHGLSAEPFKKEAADVLLAPLDPEEVEVKPGMFN